MVLPCSPLRMQGWELARLTSKENSCRVGSQSCPVNPGLREVAGPDQSLSYQEKVSDAKMRH